MTHTPIPQNTIFPVSAMLQIEMALAGAGSDLSALDRLVGHRLNLLAFCAILKAQPSAGPALTRALAPSFATFLKRDFLSLITEEEEGLLHHLERRLLLGDDLDDVIRQLSDEHRQDCQEARQLAAACLEFANGIDADWSDLCDAMAHFAERQRRHLVWEDATILPVARERLTADDLTAWGEAMERRYRFITCQAR
ncbi:hemerythrin domain-containing protein [Ferrovibrio sp.]|uniref:hemerythrin domain-containing protein n=1 Tax=Ferrovibrio sp. TaxID=1917215 RepID=UPI001B468EF2|nr:hemerythrin domain-containing protein [Ferrovibrio sp.]MBP7063678.1 hemerythrin domain-containing protein [Ferrovibrio sp.]